MAVRVTSAVLPSILLANGTSHLRETPPVAAVDVRRVEVGPAVALIATTARTIARCGGCLGHLHFEDYEGEGKKIPREHGRCSS